MNKKIIGSFLGVLMVLGLTSIPAFASMPNGTVIMGNKAFDLNYANNTANIKEISNAIAAGGELYVKDFSGKWINNVSGQTVDANVIPAVVYKNSVGVINYDAADIDQVAILAALGDSITNGMSATKGNGYVDLFYNNSKSIQGNEGIKLINLGIPGEKSRDLLSNLQNDAATKDAVSKAKMITISVGGNNLLAPVINAVATSFNLATTSPTFASDLKLALASPNNQQTLNLTLSKLPSALASGVQQFGTDWVGIIGAIKTLAPKADIYVTTLYNPLNQLDPLYIVFDPAIQGINKIIKTPNAGYKVADVYTAFHDYKGTEPLINFSLFTGNLDPHPTTKGHEVIYQSHVSAKEIVVAK
ncbi:GDSL-type esterase/lipase family protein [Clostridium estertheticum]|uniref:SGNH/GDSL hydrolase family protein n=1 Tax=Clostridium estertheticum TaxID=238834 RepID=UPI0013E91C5D|nr:GDSL-type esterase/lipase family protein [Clostridium estertheticum]MBZ9685506.1 GDSL-type esterase/lipase family protein [Clostridium estertheticum]